MVNQQSPRYQHKEFGNVAYYTLKINPLIVIEES